MIDELLTEIEELKMYKQSYESAMKDKQRMSDALYELEMYKYNNTPKEERTQGYINEWCKCCRTYFEAYENVKEGCQKQLPDNIGEPIKNNPWFPKKVSCKWFEWD